MEAGEYGITGGTCLVERCLEVRGRRAAVDFAVCFGCVPFFFLERARPAASIAPCLIHFSTCSEARPDTLSDRGYFLAYRAKKPRETDDDGNAMFQS